MDPDPVLRAEREQLELAALCLDEMLAGAERIADYGVDALASEALGKLRTQRIRHLSAERDAPAFFGRTDRDAEPGAGSSGPAGVGSGAEEIFHIGRRHVRDNAGDPVVIDWRAPIARPFYRATPADRQGVRLRRRFGFAHGELTSYEDERLDAGENLGLTSELLRQEIERPRVGPMRDIVATIQPDQDDLVRAELDVSLCVQGAPGTGKTAVGLHRAAYLLYTYPERLRRSGVLVIGPNKAFLHYIAQVLPALGEDGISQTTLEELVSHAPVRGADDPASAVLKGDARMAEVLRRALLGLLVKPTEDVVALVGTKRYRIPADRLRRHVDDCRRALGTGELRWVSGRTRLAQLLAQDVRRQREDAGGAPSDAETNRLARSAEVKAFVDAHWPAVDPRALLMRLYCEPELLRRCSASELTDDERQLLGWEVAPRSVKAARFSPADLVLLDELAGHLEGPASYAHVVLDEAQDLSPMQCRVVARRCPIGSLTVLGDLAQATTVWATGSWSTTMRHLGRPAATVRALTVGYRVPAEVLAIANALLPHIAAEVPPASSMRSGPDSLTYGRDLVTAVRHCLEAEGSVAVIAADARCASVFAELVAAGLDPGWLDDDSDAETRVVVVRSTEAKGLEYDSVVIVEPAEVVAAEPDRLWGLRRLYVAWTRAVSRLAVVHTEPLPVELEVPAAG